MSLSCEPTRGIYCFGIVLIVCRIKIDKKIIQWWKIEYANLYYTYMHKHTHTHQKSIIGKMDFTTEQSRLLDQVQHH